MEQIAFASKAHWGYSRTFLEACREELAAASVVSGPERYGVVAMVDGKPVGFYVWERSSADEFELEAYSLHPAGSVRALDVA